MYNIYSIKISFLILLLSITTNLAGQVMITFPTKNCTPAPSCIISDCNIIATSGQNTRVTGESDVYTVSGSNISSASWTITPNPTTGTGTSTGTGISTGSQTFNNTGTYTISFTTTNNSSPSGCTPPETSTCNYTVTVGASCTALSFVSITDDNGNDNKANPNQVVTYTVATSPQGSNGASSPFTYAWNNPSGTSTIIAGGGTSDNFITIDWGSASQAYNVSVTVSNDCSSKSRTYGVNVCQEITDGTMTWSPDPLEKCAFSTFSVTGLVGTDASTSYSWSTSEGFSGADINCTASPCTSAEIMFNNTGTHTVTLTITNSCGETHIISEQVTVVNNTSCTNPTNAPTIVSYTHNGPLAICERLEISAIVSGDIGRFYRTVKCGGSNGSGTGRGEAFDPCTAGATGAATCSSVSGSGFCPMETMSNQQLSFFDDASLPPQYDLSGPQIYFSQPGTYEVTIGVGSCNGYTAGEATDSRTFFVTVQ